MFVYNLLNHIPGNEAISLFKSVGKDLGVASPKELAELVKQNIKDSAIGSVSVSPQGFLNLTLSNEFLEAEIASIYFSSPNIAKEMHVGHLRSTIIGESLGNFGPLARICLARIFTLYGYKVLRINHLGDWGTHFGMLVEYMFDRYPDFMENVPSITDFTKFYKEAKLVMESDPDFQARSRKRVVMLQSGDELSIRVWKLLCEISYNEFNKIYKILDITLEPYGESFYNDMIPKVVEELREKKLAVESQGATCVFTSINKVPLMAIKSDGSYGYDSTDLACIWYRIHELKARWLIYVTDVGQFEHFRKVFEAARNANWTQQPGYDVRLDHVGFGMVQDEHGSKFKTRSGDTVKLIHLLEEAVRRARLELENRTESNGQVDDKVAEALGIAAVKYFDLKQTIGNNYKFSFDAMLDPRGNTAVYLLYAYARICQIFKKANFDTDRFDGEIKIEHPTEVVLAKTLLRLRHVLDQITMDFSTHRLAEYLYNTSVDFSAFYKQCKVVGHENQESRLALCLATMKCMKTAFQLLGITPIEKI
ncbi:bifunctional Aminoacyl-tRNA synthetase [Babesia duncani]|uniref:arginine--tRNA ligase n=1 Tax=Babesia duncani TaxID=323732 RepID=A0AAD9PP57_9APIC|nr:bifunctional Aminoacyl-tRNA synthetase [Babesia duncani]